ncbi:MAG: polysaccharide deacetylase family protein [Bacteroidia bacterium]|nr:polysaccharide deacetylase family protein [Bacteroidia bacterium]
MNRRTFVRTAALGAAGLGLGSAFKPAATHLVTLSFDDGFRQSFYTVAEIYERYGLRACLNVIASAHLPEFHSPDDYIVPATLGNFDDWNRLQRRGHEIMPHTWDHRNLTQMPLEQAQGEIDRCLAYFAQHLKGFRASRSVYSFAFNASTPELEAYALTRVRAIRTAGETPVNPLPSGKGPVRLGCWSAGPDNIDSFVDEQIAQFLAGPPGWFVFNTHGLETEGWGPLSAKYLADLLDRLTRMRHVAVMPYGEVLHRYGR